MKHKFCPHCGHPMPADEVLAALAPKEGKMFEIIRRSGTAGISNPDILEQLYANDRNGGPESGRTLISVMKRHINRKIARFDLEIHATLGAGARFYVRAK